MNSFDLYAILGVVITAILAMIKVVFKTKTNTKNKITVNAFKKAEQRRYSRAEIERNVKQPDLFDELHSKWQRD